MWVISNEVYERVDDFGDHMAHGRSNENYTLILGYFLNLIEVNYLVFRAYIF